MNMRISLAALLSGLVFGLGLAVSGLANPDKVLQFLTLDSQWSPALLFTMGTGVVVAFLGYGWVRRKGPILCDDLQWPTKTLLDRPLITGAVIFGVGWGIAGFCPGPAIAGLSSGVQEPYIFVIALIAGSQFRGLTA